MSGGIILSAPGTGNGKTTMTLALLRALKRRGLAIASAKVGPDYIDPAFHTAATGVPCINLDPWAMRHATLATLVTRLEGASDLVLCEGMMGLFDGAGATGDRGSTADLASLTGWPVMLVVDASAQAGSVAALLRGFAAHRDDVPLAGVIFNRVAGARHAAMLTAATRAALPDLPILGAVPARDDLALPERHLGLVQAREHPALDAFLDAAADHIAASVDIARFVDLARSSVLIPAGRALPLFPLGNRIAVASDEAFTFAYPALIDGWREDGAAIFPFSPLADEAPITDADAIYLPGGYPELHAGRLAASGNFRDALGAAARRGAAIYGECGGYMVLGRGLIDTQGARHAMAGLLPLETSFATRHAAIGYRAMRLIGPGPLGEAGTPFRGHEFHYATILDEGGGDALFSVADADGATLGETGRVNGRVFGSFLHLIDRAG
ncbi:MAG TPA: cobyrinate a,c-diamide synthase [Stellaceae bacterium]